ncbi:regulator of G-protein signaling 13-like isoform X2 [Dendronephthya gigantea]|uniref:regulator of G-protein signaling 13-like isoform X2 n=1 Tax=Dendronephthya gigantea TaxID=151771 RepID=UPI00106C0F3C|nr:regulator of G-protein signaling 13-like isoform X2 [Dendronephthya gigantea]
MPMGSQHSRVNPVVNNDTVADPQAFSSCCSRWTFNLSTNKQVSAGVPRPTPEEAKLWTTNFDALLANEYGLGLFKDFVKSQHCCENLNFWLDVEKYKHASGDLRESEAKRIYETYISIMSPTEISIDSKTRNTVEMNMENPSSTTFQPAQEQIYYLMKRDILPRFLKSKQYKQLRSR